MRTMDVIDETTSGNYLNASPCRAMKLFVLSAGYVAVLSHPLDLEFWESPVLPLAFGSEISAQQAIDIMQRENPFHLVSFAGGLREYLAYRSQA